MPPLLTLLSGLLLVTTLVGGGRAAVAFAFLAVGLPPALMALGAARRALGRAAAPIAAVWIALTTGLAAILLLGPSADSEALWLGLPPAAAVLVYGLGLALLVVVALGFARAFDDFAPAPEEIERLRAVGRDRRED